MLNFGLIQTASLSSVSSFYHGWLSLSCFRSSCIAINNPTVIVNCNPILGQLRSNASIIGCTSGNR